MKKTLLLTLFFAMFALPAFAKDQVTIFEIPREPASRDFYTSTGKPIKLSSLKGKFTLVVFWSKHCGPCVRELKDLNEFYLKTRDDGIDVVMISADNEWESINEQRRYLDRRGARDLDFYLDRRGDLTADVGIFSFPNSLLINSSGKEIGRVRGSAKWGKDDIIEQIYQIKAKSNDYERKKDKRLMKVDKIEVEEI